MQVKNKKYNFLNPAKLSLVCQGIEKDEDGQWSSKSVIDMGEVFDVNKKILEEEEVSRNSEEFKNIEKLLGKNTGWIGLFTKFYFKDGESFSMLEDLYRKLEKLKPILNR